MILFVHSCCYPEHEGHSVPVGFILFTDTNCQKHLALTRSGPNTRQILSSDHQTQNPMFQKHLYNRVCNKSQHYTPADILLEFHYEIEAIPFVSAILSPTVTLQIYFLYISYSRFLGTHQLTHTLTY